jgi:hypothetical protein
MPCGWQPEITVMIKDPRVVVGILARTEALLGIELIAMELSRGRKERISHMDLLPD